MSYRFQRIIFEMSCNKWTRNVSDYTSCNFSEPGGFRIMELFCKLFRRWWFELDDTIHVGITTLWWISSWWDLNCFLKHNCPGHKPCERWICVSIDIAPYPYRSKLVVQCFDLRVPSQIIASSWHAVAWRWSVRYPKGHPPIMTFYIHLKDNYVDDDDDNDGVNVNVALYYRQIYGFKVY